MIIAVDFDGVLVTNDFPRIGAPIQPNIDLTKELIQDGHEVILWTSRVEAELEAAVLWCNAHGLVFCAVNDDAPSNRRQYTHIYKERPRKIYADLYIDDHAPGYDPATLRDNVYRRIQS